MAAPLLLLVARDLLLHDPPRVLAWRLLHEAGLADLPGWLRVLAPAGAPFDHDPLALLLGAGCSGVAAALLVAALAGARARARAALLGLGALFAVALPTVSLMAMGAAMGRPYGQDGGVVQLPLALDLLLQGRSPYGADYSAGMLGRQARVSPFWQAYGGNPLLRHHAYLPGTHLLMLPGHLLARAAGVAFDPRAVTLAALAAAAWLAARLGRASLGSEGALAGAAVVLVSPLVYWPQAFGANDILQAALLLCAVALAASGRPAWCGAVLGLACASKQLAWPYAPFLLAHLSGAATLRELAAAASLRRMARPALAAALVFGAIVVPVLALDPRGFWGDIVVYNVGLPGGESYPLGGTPGFGFANFLIYFGEVASLRDHVSFAPFYALLAPLCLLLLRRQLREPHPAAALVTGSVALLASVYVSRVAHPNYLVLAAILLPVGLLATRGGARAASAAPRPWPVDTAVGPLLLFLAAVALVEHEPLRTTWEDAVAARLPEHASALAAILLPRAGPHLTADPLGLLFAAIAAGLGVAWAFAAVLGAPVRSRLALLTVAVGAVVLAPAAVLARVGAATGVPRAQDAWLVPVSASARAASGIVTPAPPREAWSQSFRLDPPRVLEAAPRGSLAQRALGALLATAGYTDPRPLLALSLVIAAGLAAWTVRSDMAPLAAAVFALTPPAALGTLFGSGEALPLALAAAALGARGRRARLVLLALALLAAAPYRPLPVVAPALGLPNVLLYAQSAAVSSWPLIALGAVAALAIAFFGRRAHPLFAAAAALLAWLWIVPAASPAALALPIALLALSAIPPPHSTGGSARPRT